MNNSIDAHDASLAYNFAMEPLIDGDDDMLELVLLQRDWTLEGMLWELRCDPDHLESEHGTYDQLYDMLDETKRKRAELNDTEFKPARRKPR